VTAGREKLFDLFPVAVGTGHLFIAENQNLEVLVALATVILKNRHQVISSKNAMMTSGVGVSFTLSEMGDN
jgi:hypothetical protein